jgi:sugar phosphate isomerase/epimerase
MRNKIGFIGDNGLADVEADAKFAAEHGFDALEYNYWDQFRDLEADTIRRMREILDAHGVGCSSLGLWGWNHLSPDADERAEAHEMLRRAIEFGATLGARVLVTGGGDIPDAPLEEKVEQFAEVFPPFLEAIEKAGMIPAMYAVHGNSFFDGIEAYERVWERFPQVGVKYDPANWRHHGDDYLAVVRRHGDKVQHVHLKEHVYHEGELASQPAAGMGDIEWGKVFAFLYEHGYEGHLSIEPHGPIWSRGEMRHTMLLLTQRYIGQFLL